MHQKFQQVNLLSLICVVLLGVFTCTPPPDDKLEPVVPITKEVKPAPKSNPDGSTEITGHTSSGEEFSMTTQVLLNFAEFGLREYPHIIPNDVVTRNAVIETNRGKTITIIFTTKDSLNQVSDFYDALIIPKEKSITKTGEGTIISGETATGTKLAIIISNLGTDTQVSISGSLDK